MNLPSFAAMLVPMIHFDPALRYRNLPIAALVGRPNVGKSTLFNRLLHRRRAITSPVPGVTRDPVEEQAFLSGTKSGISGLFPVRLVDTGGFKLDREKTVPAAGSAARSVGAARSAGATRSAGADPRLDKLVVERTLEIIESADIIVLLLEAGELTPEDEEFIALLRPRWPRIIAAVNKTEGGRRESEAWDVFRYGFNDLILVSAEHGDHVAELEAAIVSRLDFSAVEMEDDPSRPIALALLGKPNTGKSTLSNRLTASAASIVSEVPGTTRDVVEGNFRYKNKHFRVLDTAGIRRKSKVTENIEYYSVNRAVKTLDEADIVFLLIDAQEGLTEQDKKIAALASNRGRGIVFVLNKWDELKADGDTLSKKTLAAMKERIHFFFGQMEYAPVMPLSAANGYGVDALLETASRMYGQLCRRIDTPALNRALAAWLEEYPPPQGPQTRFKIKYAAQVSANPVQFSFFASRPGAVSEAYRAYLRNRIRKDLGFSLIPVEAEICPSRRERNS